MVLRDWERCRPGGLHPHREATLIFELYLKCRFAEGEEEAAGTAALPVAEHHADAPLLLFAELIRHCAEAFLIERGEGML
jgi:hypothetical protein